MGWMERLFAAQRAWAGSDGPWELKTTGSRRKATRLVASGWELLSANVALVHGTSAGTVYHLRRPNRKYRGSSNESSQRS
jgi:hypothetical protein